MTYFCFTTMKQKMDSMDMISRPGRSYRYATDGVLYPFGYGLSYTTFFYDSLTLSSTALSRHPLDIFVNATITIINTGQM